MSISCNYKCKNNSTLNQHLSNIHNINVVWFDCDFDNCTYQSKNKGSLKKHKANVHFIGVKWKYCDQLNCNYKCKHNSNLNKHKVNIHSINVVWKYCDQPNCDSKFKSKGGLKRHLEFVHDIGAHKCDICFNNRNSSIKYTYNKIKSKICRKCFKKVTGKSSRAEEVMSDYLDKLEILKPFLVGSDKSFKSMGGCQLYRPDKLYTSSDLILHIECIIIKIEMKIFKEFYTIIIYSIK